VTCVPARDDEVDGLSTGRREQLRDDLRWVLQVRVHHQGPGTAGCPHPTDDGSAQAPRPLVGRPPEETNRQVEPVSDSRHLARGVVIGIVHEEDLRGRPGECRGKPVDQWRDVVDFIARRNDDSEFGPRKIQMFVHCDWLQFGVRNLIRSASSRCA